MSDAGYDTHGLVRWEIAQRRVTGYDVEEIATAFEQVDPDDDQRIQELSTQLQESVRTTPWTYDEPDAAEEVLASLPADKTSTPPIDQTTLHDKVLGGWLGRIAGCNLGKPVEDGDHWTAPRLRDYLQRAGAYPLRDYIPALDPMPDGFILRSNWTQTTLGRVNGSARDDDIDYTILGLHLLEEHGAGLKPEHVGAAWLNLLPYMQTYTAERVAYRNLVHGVRPPATATRANPYREWIGAQIRGDIYGWVYPGRPRQAARLALQDATLSHTGNGIYGEMWVAALVSCAFVADTPGEAILASLNHIPPNSRLAEALRDVVDQHASGVDWDTMLEHLQKRYGHYYWVHTLNNAALVASALLWGDGDYSSSAGLAVQGAWDTDCNGATAGSVAGTLLGAKALPEHFIEPLHNHTRSALLGFDNSKISDLAARTLLLANGKLG